MATPAFRKAVTILTRNTLLSILKVSPFGWFQSSHLHNTSARSLSSFTFWSNLYFPEISFWFFMRQMIVDLCTDTFSRQTSQKIALFVPCAESFANSRIFAAGETWAVVISACTSRVFLFLLGSRLNVRLRARSDFSGALYKDRALTTCLSCGFLSFFLVSDFYQFRVWFLHRVLLDC